MAHLAGVFAHPVGAGAGLAHLAGTPRRWDVGHTPGGGCRAPGGALPNWQWFHTRPGPFRTGGGCRTPGRAAPPSARTGRGGGGLGAGGGAGPSSLAAPPRPVPAPWRARLVPTVPGTPGMC